MMAKRKQTYVEPIYDPVDDAAFYEWRATLTFWVLETFARIAWHGALRWERTRTKSRDTLFDLDK